MKGRDEKGREEERKSRKKMREKRGRIEPCDGTCPHLHFLTQRQ